MCGDESVHDVIQGLLGSGWAGQLRFNEDLSTRPAWLPPDSGPPNLAVAQCWTRLPNLPANGTLLTLHLLHIAPSGFLKSGGWPSSVLEDVCFTSVFEVIR